MCDLELSIEQTTEFKEGRVLLINKALEWTSFDVIKRIRRILQIPKLKVGHAGTLDPLATGLLIVCTGKKSRSIHEYQDLEKEYEGSFMLGQETPSYDLETNVSKEFAVEQIQAKTLPAIAQSFIGAQTQIPPHYSAVKINGVRSYKLARRGSLMPALQARNIEIKKFDINLRDFPLIHFRVVCSKGTYIRALVRDFAHNLNNGAHLRSLVRTRIGEFKLEDSMSIEVFKESLTRTETLCSKP